MRCRSQLRARQLAKGGASMFSVWLDRYHKQVLLDDSRFACHGGFDDQNKTHLHHQ